MDGVVVHLNDYAGNSTPPNGSGPDFNVQSKQVLPIHFDANSDGVLLNAIHMISISLLSGMSR